MILEYSVHGSLHRIHRPTRLLGKLWPNHHLLAIAMLHWLHRWSSLHHLRVRHLLLELLIVLLTGHHLYMLVLLSHPHALHIYMPLFRCHRLYLHLQPLTRHHTSWVIRYHVGSLWMHLCHHVVWIWRRSHMVCHSNPTPLNLFLLYFSQRVLHADVGMGSSRLGMHRHAV